jgi:hypothetical protein
MRAAESVTVALMAAVILMAINAWDPITGKMRRFSMRSVLFWITVFSFVLGFIVYMAKK